MKLNKTITSLTLLSAIGLMSQAQAAGTLAGTAISNTANLQFAIGGVAQTPKASNTVSFVVDNKVNLIFAEDNGGVPTTVTPNALKQIFKFKLTNIGNAVQDYSFFLTSITTGSILYGHTDNVDVSGCAAYVDSANNNGTYEETIDTTTYVDELAPDTSKSVFLRCNLLNAPANNDFAGYIVGAVTATGGTTGTKGSNLTKTTGANTAGIDVVFADGVGAYPLPTYDIVKDGRMTAVAGYLVQSATLEVIKTSAPICDPLNFNVDPKNIPGAYIRYNITISNDVTASRSGNLNTLTDILDTTNLTFDPNFIVPTASSCSTPEAGSGQSFKITCTGGTRACTTTPIYRTAVGGDDGFDFTSPNITANLGVALPIETGYTAGELKAGESVRVEFNAVVK